MRRILVVEDDRDVRVLLAEEIGLSSALFAESGADAIALVLAMPEIAAVITDLDLGPGPNGLDVLRTARAANPACVRVVVTAGYDRELGVNTSALVDAVFRKPWTLGTIRAYVQRRLDGSLARPLIRPR
jgi:CheY-like chemotaxis protein